MTSRPPLSQAQELYKKFVQFEKTHGDRHGIEGVVVGKKRFQYEETVRNEPFAYDAWFDYARLEESSIEAPADYDRCREVYERAISNVPPAPDKRLWRRYIFLWLKYAIFEELTAKDVDRARAVLTECRRVVPHAHFTFAKVWEHSALFEVRQGKLDAARKLLGFAIGRCPKAKLFKIYVQLELQLGEVRPSLRKASRRRSCFPLEPHVYARATCHRCRGAASCTASTCSGTAPTAPRGSRSPSSRRRSASSSDLARSSTSRSHSRASTSQRRCGRCAEMQPRSQASRLAAGLGAQDAAPLTQMFPFAGVHRPGDRAGGVGARAWPVPGAARAHQARQGIADGMCCHGSDGMCNHADDKRN